MDIKTEIKTEADESMCDESEMNSLKELGADIAMEETDIKTEIKTEVIIDPSKINCLQALGPYIATKDNSESFQYFSDIPKLCFEKPCILGVDEAGRGPVLGKMNNLTAMILENDIQMSNCSFHCLNVLFDRSHGIRYCLLRQRRRRNSQNFGLRRFQTIDRGKTRPYIR